MICEDCAAAADLVAEPSPLIEASRELAVQGHGRCRGCSCQHQVPPAQVIAARRQAMPRGGLTRVVAGFAPR